MGAIIQLFTGLLGFAGFFLMSMLRPKPKLEGAKPAGLGEFQVTTATEGRSVPMVWGTVRIKGPNVVWYGDLRQVAIKQKVPTGLFSSKKVVIGYRYFLGLQWALCRGTGVVLKRIWVGGKEVFSGSVSHEGTAEIDEPKLFGGDKLGQGGVSGTLQLFSGTLSQDPSDYLSDFQKEPPDTGDTPGYHGTAYLCPESAPLYVGNSTSLRPWEFEVERILDPLSLGADARINSSDANPVNVMYELMTDTDWGWGLSPSVIDTSMFAAVGAILADEGNGFSFLLDNPLQAGELRELIEQQIDGLFYLNQATAKWEVKLRRADYDVDDLVELNLSNIRALETWATGTWEETTNEVLTEFNDRADEYKITYAPAQDNANAQLQAGVHITTTKRYPGVKNGDLANAIAWRNLRVLSRPLGRGTILVDRSLYAVTPAQVLALTWPELGFVKRPVRVNTIDLGDLTNNEIRLEVVEDIFRFGAGSFGTPPESGWEEPTDDLQPFDADKQLAFEAPRGFVTRDPDFVGLLDKVWVGARRKGPEVAFAITERHTVGTPSGAFTEVGEVYDFLLIGQLNASLAVGSAYPLTTLVLTATPDLRDALEAAFPDGTPEQIGTELSSLILVGGASGEFMLPTSAQVSGANVQLNGVYRGVLDSTQQAHSSGANVYLVFIAGGLIETSIEAGNTVDVRLLPRSVSDDVPSASATTITFDMLNRIRRPYPPSALRLDGVLWSSSTSLEANGAGAETFAIDALLNRRDYRTVDEVEALSTDAASIFSDFPTVNGTTQEIDVRNDPNGANTFLFTDSFAGPQHDVLRLRILQATDGVLPTRLRFVMRARHTDGSSLASRSDLTFDFNVTTALTGQFAFGAIDTNDVSNLYTATAAGTYAFTLSSSFGSGDVEYRLNGGSWTTLISSGNTSGSIVGVVVSDTIEVRHTSATPAMLKQLDMNAPGAGTDAFAVLFT